MSVITQFRAVVLGVAVALTTVPAQADTLAAVGNFTPVLRDEFRVGVPYPGFWKEILNTDAKDYGGPGYGNNGGVQAEEIEWDGRPYSIKLQLPPQSMSCFRYQG